MDSGPGAWLVQTKADRQLERSDQSVIVVAPELEEPCRTTDPGLQAGAVVRAPTAELGMEGLDGLADHLCRTRTVRAIVPDTRDHVRTPVALRASVEHESRPDHERWIFVSILSVSDLVFPVFIDAARRGL